MAVYDGKIEAVFFDLGGVLIVQPVDAILRYCADCLETDPERLLASHRQYDVDIQTGRLSERDYWARICPELGVSQPDRTSLWGDAFAYAYCEHQEIFSLVAELHRKGYRTGLLSNTEPPAMNYFLSRGYEDFDCLVFSCLEGTVKPDPEIYRIALRKSQTAPERTVFIDDREENVTGAQRVGIRGILYETPRQVKTALMELGITIDL